MIAQQVSYLETLIRQAGKPDSNFNPDRTKAEASGLIDELQQKTGRGAGKID